MNEDQLIDAAEREMDLYRNEITRVQAAAKQKLDEALDDFHFERKQVVELRAVLGEMLTCMAAGDPALLDADQVAEWRERAGIDD